MVGLHLQHGDYNYCIDRTMSPSLHASTFNREALVNEQLKKDVEVIRKAVGSWRFVLAFAVRRTDGRGLCGGMRNIWSVYMWRRLKHVRGFFIAALSKCVYCTVRWWTQADAGVSVYRDRIITIVDRMYVHASWDARLLLLIATDRRELQPHPVPQSAVFGYLVSLSSAAVRNTVAHCLSRLLEDMPAWTSRVGLWLIIIIIIIRQYLKAP